VVFTVSSLLCGLVSDIYLLVALRGIQAIGGSAFMPSATGLVADHFGKNRGRAVGMFVGVTPIGALIGPVVGGVLVTYWSWRGIFLVNVPIGLLLFVLAWRFIPAGDKKPSDQPLDVWGGVLLSVAILAGILGVSLLGSGDIGAGSASFIGLEVVALVLVVCFVRHIGASRHPFIPVRMLYGSNFGVLNLLNFLYGGGVLGFATLVPLYAVERFHVTTIQSGTLLNARAIGMICAATTVSWLLHRTGCRWPLAIGFVLTSIGMVGMSLDAPLWSPYAWLAVFTGIAGIGMGTAGPASMNASLQLSTTDIAAIASMRQMFRQIGSISAVSIATAVAGQSVHPGVALGHVFFGFGLLMLAVLPLLHFVADNRGDW
jgi:MFS family permease